MDRFRQQGYTPRVRLLPRRRTLFLERSSHGHAQETFLLDPDWCIYLWYPLKKEREGRRETMDNFQKTWSCHRCGVKVPMPCRGFDSDGITIPIHSCKEFRNFENPPLGFIGNDDVAIILQDPRVTFLQSRATGT